MLPHAGGVYDQPAELLEELRFVDYIVREGEAKAQERADARRNKSWWRRER